MANDRREGLLVANRISELAEQPIVGKFDLPHLKAIHAHLFQDLPHHRPGEVRSDTESWGKMRQLESRAAFYAVHYASSDVAGLLDRTLKQHSDLSKPTGQEASQFAARLGALYGDLDFAHGFYEGNSRTLREFTRTLAQSAGFKLDWAGTGVDAQARDRLYMARDVAVLDRFYPGLTEQRAMTTQDRSEYEAWFMVNNVRRAQTGTLEQIIAERTTPAAGAAKATPAVQAEAWDKPPTPLTERHGSFREMMAAERARKAAPAQQADKVEPAAPGPSYRSSSDPSP